MEIDFPQIQPDVRGPDGQPGFLLIVPRSEAIEWDVRNEIGSTSRYWVRERQAWWVAAPYRHAAEGIVARYSRRPAPPAPELRREPEPAAAPPPARPRARWAGLEALLRRLWRPSSV